MSRDRRGIRRDPANAFSRYNAFAASTGTASPIAGQATLLQRYARCGNRQPHVAADMGLCLT